MTKAERFRRVQLNDHSRYLRNRYGHELPNDDAGRDDLYELLLTISLGDGADRKMRHAIGLWAQWMSRDEIAQHIDGINRTPDYLRKRTARDLGERWGLTYEERQAWGIRTVAPCDLTEEEFQQRRKDRKNYRQWLRRRSAGASTRAEWLAANSLSRTKPWAAEDVSRRTWERRRRKQADAGVVPIKLTNAGVRSASLSVLKGERGTSEIRGRGRKRRKGRNAA